MTHVPEQDPQHRPLADQSQRPVDPGIARARAGHGRHARAARRRKVVRAAGWILAIAILQLLAGVFFGMRTGRDADAAIRNLAGYEEDEMLELEDGTEVLAGELRRRVERERVQAYVIPIGLGVVFLGLAWWATKAALPAILTALALYVTLHVVEGIIDPTTIPKGILIKILFVAALLQGLRAALSQRDAALRDAAQTAG